MSRGLFPDTDLLRSLAEKVFGRAKPTPTSLSPDTAGPTIGGSDCWCGRPRGHDWLGREDGAPHPRYPD